MPHKKNPYLEEDLESAGRMKEGGEARCVPLGKGAMLLPVCKGGDALGQQEGHQHFLKENGEVELSDTPKGGTEKTEEKTEGSKG